MMITPRKEDAYHKLQLYQLLSAIIDKEALAMQLRFKGGTCAALLGYLDRFSVDLDFDLAPGTDNEQMKKHFYAIFRALNLEIKDESQKTLLFILKYHAPAEKRNTIKLDAIAEGYQANMYAPQYLSDIDRYMHCQTRETMFANKLVALIDRYEKHGAIAGRDLYDIRHFFAQGYDYNEAVITERRQDTPGVFFTHLISFIEKNLTQRTIDEDLSMLLPNPLFQKIRKNLKQETLVLLKDELQRLQ